MEKLVSSLSLENTGLLSSEQQIPLQEPILTYVTLERQASISFDFIEAVASFADPQDAEFITSCRVIVEDVQRGVSEEDPTVTAIACFDRCLADEIMAEEEQRLLEADKASEYFRAAAYHQRYPQALLEAIAKVLGYAPERMIVGLPAHLATYAAEMPGQRGMLTPTLAFLVPEIEERKVWPCPPISVARQVLYRSLLECGLNPLAPRAPNQRRVQKPSLPDPGATYPTLMESQLSVWDPSEKAEHLYRRLRQAVGTATMTNNVDFYAATNLTASELELVMRERSMDWGWLLAAAEPQCPDCPADERAQAILFNSGTAANEAALRALAPQLGERAAFVDPTWYQENLPTAEKLLRRTEDLSAAHALLVGVGPTSFFLADPPVYARERIKDFLSHAAGNPQQPYYLVFDVTVDLVVTAANFAGQPVPPNVRLIKTASLTKHQAGSRRYFFGAVYSPCARLRAGVQQERAAVGGQLLDSQPLYFPSLKHIGAGGKLQFYQSEILQHCQSLSTISSDTDGWAIQRADYFCFICPPTAFVEEIVAAMTGESDPSHPRMQAVNEQIVKVVKTTLAAIGNSGSPFGVRMGQSFGLPDTRISFQSTCSVIRQVKFLLKAPRIAPGYLTERANLLAATAVVLEALNKALPELVNLLRR